MIVIETVRSKSKALDSSRNHPPNPWSIENLSSVKPVPGAKEVGDAALEDHACGQGSEHAQGRLEEPLIVASG